MVNGYRSYFQNTILLSAPVHIHRISKIAIKTVSTKS